MNITKCENMIESNYDITQVMLVAYTANRLWILFFELCRISEKITFGNIGIATN